MFKLLSVLVILLAPSVTMASSADCRLNDAIKQPYAMMRVFLKRPRLGLCQAFLIVSNEQDKFYFDSLYRSHRTQSTAQLVAMGLLNIYIENRIIYIYKRSRIFSIFVPISKSMVDRKLLDRSFVSNVLRMEKVPRGVLIYADPVVITRLWRILPVELHCNVQQYVHAKVIVVSLNQLRSMSKIFGCDFTTRLKNEGLSFGTSTGAGTMLELFEQVFNNGSGYFWVLNNDKLTLIGDTDLINLKIPKGNLTKDNITSILSSIGIYGNAIKILASTNKDTVLEVAPIVAQALMNVFPLKTKTKTKKRSRTKITKPMLPRVLVEYGN